MKKEVSALEILTKKGRIGGEAEKTIIKICNNVIVVETEAVEGITETIMSEEEEDRRRKEVKQFLDDNNLKMFSIAFKSGGKIYNCIMPAEKPLISFFDE